MVLLVAKAFALLHLLLLFDFQPVKSGSALQVKVRTERRSSFSKTSLRVRSRWSPGRRAVLRKVVWLDNVRLLCVAKLSAERSGLLLFPVRKVLTSWKEGLSAFPGSYARFEPELIVSSGYLYFVRNLDIVKAQIHSDSLGVHLGSIKRIVSIQSEIDKFKRSPADIHNSSLAISWGVHRGGVLYSVFAHPGDYFAFRGLRSVRQVPVTAMSTDCQAFFVFSKRGAEVWHVEPARDRVVWRRRLSRRPPDSEVNYMDSISWSSRRQAAIVTYSSDTAGAASVVEIVTKSRNRLVYNPYNHQKLAEIMIAPERARWFQAGIVFSGATGTRTITRKGRSDTVELYRIGLWSQTKNTLRFPGWGRDGDFPEVSPDGRQFAFIRTEPGTEKSALIVVR